MIAGITAGKLSDSATKALQCRATSIRYITGFNDQEFASVSVSWINRTTGVLEQQERNHETYTIQFFSLIFTSLALAPALAHLLELPHKIGLARDDYFIVQQIYAGWSLLGIVVAGALVSTFLLTLVLRKRSIP